jgi:hypothetical protein
VFNLPAQFLERSLEQGKRLALVVFLVVVVAAVAKLFTLTHLLTIYKTLAAWLKPTLVLAIDA